MNNALRSSSAASQLEVLALEPFYGGVRRIMLETLIRHSRHRWTLLRLPPRRIERRLAVAAHWFAEQLTRHWVGRFDVLFTSEAMNLSDLHRLLPIVSRKPSVVYFHANQLPDPANPAEADNPLDVVNLSTAAAATEIWFNSLFHLRHFLSRATSLVERHPELFSQNPLPDLAAKAQHMPPPLDLSALFELVEQHTIRRQPHTIFVDTRDADLNLLNAAFSYMQRRAHRFKLITVGPIDDLMADLPRRTVGERDELAQTQAMYESGIVLSAKRDAACDHYLVRALTLGCWPVAPNSGVYPELIPEQLHEGCLYDGTYQRLVDCVLDAWGMGRPEGYHERLFTILHSFDALNACRAIDQRLEELAIAHSISAELS